MDAEGSPISCFVRASQIRIADWVHPDITACSTGFWSLLQAVPPRCHPAGRAIVARTIVRFAVKLALLSWTSTLPETEDVSASALRLIARQSHVKALNLDYVAGQLSVSRFRLSRDIARTDHGFWTHVHGFRAVHALLMMEAPAVSQKEIGDTIGYLSQSAYSRGFRKIIGMTPSQFRTARRQDCDL